jgi:hypothetical protein
MVDLADGIVPTLAPGYAFIQGSRGTHQLTFRRGSKYSGVP